MPCKERVRFKNLTGDKLTFKANKTYVHCEVSQGAQTECIVWHRVEEVCCRQQAGEGSDGFVLLGPAFTKGGCLRGAVWKRHGRCLGRIRNVVPNLPRVLPEMTMVGASASMSVMPTKFFRYTHVHNFPSFFCLFFFHFLRLLFFCFFISSCALEGTGLLSCQAVI